MTCQIARGSLDICMTFLEGKCVDTGAEIQGRMLRNGESASISDGERIVVNGYAFLARSKGNLMVQAMGMDRAQLYRHSLADCSALC